MERRSGYYHVKAKGSEEGQLWGVAWWNNAAKSWFLVAHPCPEQDSYFTEIGPAVSRDTASYKRELPQPMDSPVEFLKWVNEMVSEGIYEFDGPNFFDGTTVYTPEQLYEQFIEFKIQDNKQ